MFLANFIFLGILCGRFLMCKSFDANGSFTYFQSNLNFYLNSIVFRMLLKHEVDQSVLKIENKL